MLRRFSRLLACSVRQRDELLKMLRENPQTVSKADAESGAHFRDIRPTPLNESLDAKRRRLIYQSGYRGMAEMDIILGCFVRRHINDMSDEQLNEYDTLLRHFDNDLYNWLVMGKTPPPAVATMGAFMALNTFVQGERESLLDHIL